MKKKKSNPRRVVVVCGGRDYDDCEYIHNILDEEHAKRPILFLIHGNAKGADGYAGAWCQVAKGVHEVKVPALWGKWGKGAGPIRNRAMPALTKVNKLIAFPGGNGTKDMIAVARKLGIPVRIVKPRVLVPIGKKSLLLKKVVTKKLAKGK